MSHEEKLNYLATTKDEGNKRYISHPLLLSSKINGKEIHVLAIKLRSLDFRFAHWPLVSKFGLLLMSRKFFFGDYNDGVDIFQ